jgi:hypothetical protein
MPKADYGEMLCPDCGNSIIPEKVEGGFNCPGEWAACPDCGADVEGEEFEEWLVSKSEY